MRKVSLYEKEHTRSSFERSHKYGFNDIRFQSDAEAVCMKSNYLLLTVDTVTVIGELQYYLDGKNFCTLKNTAIGLVSLCNMVAKSWHLNPMTGCMSLQN